MKFIQVNSLPLKDVISDFAREFDTEFSENCEEYVVHLPEHIGQGWIKGINFKVGLGIIQYDCTFYEDIEIRFVVNEIHPLKFLYCIEGVLYHRFGNGEETHTIEQYKKAIVASNRKDGHVLFFKGSTRVVVNSLEIARERFVRNISCDLQSMDANLKRLFEDVEATEEFYHDGFYSLQLANSFGELERFEESDFLKKLFLEGKAYQLLTRQIIEYQDDLKDSDHSRILRKSEIRMVLEAATIIREELSAGPTVKSLARRVGLNPNKLQQGFQHNYRTTVNQYIQNERLEKAEKLLLDKDLTMAQIVNRIGLASNSYFSKIFKKKYKVTPSQFRLEYFQDRRDDNGTTEKGKG